MSDDQCKAYCEADTRCTAATLFYHAGNKCRKFSECTNRYSEANTDVSKTFERRTITTVPTNGVAFRSQSSQGEFHVPFDKAYFISKVNLYWPGSWGAGTNSFEVLLTLRGVTTSVYSTTSAPRTANGYVIEDRITNINLDTRSQMADSITLKCRARSDNGYSLYEIEAIGS